MCRGKAEIDDSLKQKISMFCMVDIKQVRIFLCNQMFQLSFVVNICHCYANYTFKISCQDSFIDLF